MRFLPGVNEGVLRKSAVVTERLIALRTVVRFLPCVHEGVGLQMTFLTEGFFTLGAVILLGSDVDLFMFPKPTTACKRLWTLVTRFQIFHSYLIYFPLTLLADN